MTVPCERQQQVVTKGLGRSLHGEEIAQHSPSEAGNHLNVAQRRHPQIHVRLAQDRADRRRSIGLQQVLEERRRIGDDRAQ
jgi:hypothetical protein